MRLTLEDVRGALRDYRPPSEIGRHELTNEQWLLIRELFPNPETRRGSPRHPRGLLDGMFWTLRTGAPWRDLPRERYGSWQTVWRRFDQWRREGRLEVVERCVSWLKECRRVATRFEKLAVNYVAMIDLAIIQRLLRAAVS